MKNSKKPAMIIFDYGHTLVYEDKWEGVNGAKALLEYAVSNKNNLTAEQISEVEQNLFFNARKNNSIEIHQHQFQRLLYEYLQIDINLPPERMEEIYWDNASKSYAMPNIKETLDYLHANNIRSAVISNISFSQAALKKRINRIFPNNNFEFIIATSEYVYRKPSPVIFELALRKAGLMPCDAWYCGDSIDFDVMGANSAGIFPVWYESEIKCWYKDRGSQTTPDPGCEYLHIKNWLELIDALSTLVQY